jgi:hypothetical protein
MKTNMRKLLILPVALLIITSCKKSTSGTTASGTITATIDGTPTNFNTDAIAVRTNVSGVYQVAINGYQGAISTSNQISIGIGGAVSVTAGTYGDVPGPAPDEVSLVYIQQPGTGEYAAIGTSPDTATVVITSISASEVRGTFFGGLVLSSGSTSPSTHTITNGSFDVKF